jgi:hypothetical protein
MIKMNLLKKVFNDLPFGYLSKITDCLIASKGFLDLKKDAYFFLLN